jgi:hypothetical protein
MKLTSLTNLLCGSLAPADYSAEIAAELAEHTRHLGRCGSAPVSVTEDTDLLLDRNRLAVLCRLFASGRLTVDEVAYTADALLMAERVDYSAPEIADDLGICMDPQINGALTVARTLEIAGGPA